MGNQELSEREMESRSVLMRVYHSRITGEAFYPGRFVNGAAAELETKGWIERRGDGWRMTEDGVKAWAEMSAPVISSRWKNGGQNELAHLTGLPIVRLKLPKSAQAMLAALAQNGGALPLESINDLGQKKYGDHGEVIAVTGLQTLMNGVYVIHDGKTVKLTEVGRRVVSEMNLQMVSKEERQMDKKTCTADGCAEPRMVSKKGRVLTMCIQHQKEYWREHKSKKGRNGSAQRPPHPATEERASASAPMAAPACGECEQECIYREVVEMLRGKNGQIDELVEAVRRVNEIKKAIGL